MLTQVIAEAGLNHRGSEYLAMLMVEQALQAKADVVKFQTYDLDQTVRAVDPVYNTLKELSLKKESFVKLAKYAAEEGIEFLSTPGDIGSLKFLVEECGVKRIKIGSDDLTNYKLIDAALQTNLPLIISTGMGTLTEIDELALPANRDITLLHCVSLYPCPHSKVNLRAMDTLREQYGFPVGYSDHTRGIDTCIVAAARGAVIVEKHFMSTNSETMYVDGPVSVCPIKLRDMIQSIKAIERMLGDGKKEPSLEEAKNIPVLRKGADGKRGWL